MRPQEEAQMTMKSHPSKADTEIVDLLRRILAVQLFQLGVPQATIKKRVGLSINVVNDLLKGIKKNG
jgi:hypothetical protein